MAHELDFTKGFAAIAFAGDTPWHGYGTNMALTPDASLADWIKASGLDYEIMRATVQYKTLVESDAHGHSYPVLREAPGNDVLYRSDNGSHVGIVSDGYQIVQPDEIARFFEDACKAHGFKLETMGALRNGAVYWALARTGHVMGEARGDATHGFVLISTSADGSASTSVQQTSVRVVCANTLAVALGGRNATRVRHSTTFRAEEVKKQMGLLDLDASWEAFRAKMNALAHTKVTSDEASAFFSELLRPTKATTAAGKGAQSFADLLAGNVALADAAAPTDKDPRAIRGLADIVHSYESAPGATPGNAYGLVQGVTHYVDHVRGNDAKRLQSAWFGQGASMKERAMESALTLAGVRELANA